MELYSFGSLLGALLGEAIVILLLSWLAGLFLRVPEAIIRKSMGYDRGHPLFRGHHTRRVLTTVLGFVWNVQLDVSEYERTLSRDPSLSPFPSEEPWVTVLSSDYMVIALVAGALVLGIRIFGNPPPLEDEEENDEEPSESDHQAVSPGKLSPGGNRNWLFAFLGVGLIVVFVYIGSMPDPEASTALEEELVPLLGELDSLVAEMRQETDENLALFDSASSEITTPTSTYSIPDEARVYAATEQEEAAAIVRVTVEFTEMLLEMDAELAEEYGMSAEPNAMWLENDYYIRPSAYPDVRSYFLSFLDYLAASRELSSPESVQMLFEELLADEGMGDSIENIMQGYRRSYYSGTDTLFMVRAAYGETVLALHDELLDFEGGFYVDSASGELAFSGMAPPDTLFVLDERVGILAREMVEREAQSVTNMESLVDSLGVLVR